MANPLGVPEITVQDVAQKRASDDVFVLMDVREHTELAIANLGEGVEHVPMSEIAALREDALPESVDDKSTEIVVFCHHGGRSAQICAWLRQQGWENVLNMDGGINAYSMQVDPSIARY